MARHGENIYHRRDGRFEGRYVIGRRSDGRTKFGYIYGRQYTDVQRRLMIKKVEHINQLNPGVTREQTLAQWMDCWLKHELAYSVKASTIQMYDGLTRNHLLPYLGEYCLSQLTPCHDSSASDTSPSERTRAKQHPLGGETVVIGDAGSPGRRTHQEKSLSQNQDFV